MKIRGSFAVVLLIIILLILAAIFGVAKDILDKYGVATDSQSSTIDANINNVLTNLTTKWSEFEKSIPERPQAGAPAWLHPEYVLFLSPEFLFIRYEDGHVQRHAVIKVVGNDFEFIKQFKYVYPYGELVSEYEGEGPSEQETYKYDFEKKEWRRVTENPFELFSEYENLNYGFKVICPTNFFIVKAKYDDVICEDEDGNFISVWLDAATGFADWVEYRKSEKYENNGREITINYLRSSESSAHRIYTFFAYDHRKFLMTSGFSEENKAFFGDGEFFKNFLDSLEIFRFKADTNDWLDFASKDLEIMMKYPADWSIMTDNKGSIILSRGEDSIVVAKSSSKPDCVSKNQVCRPIYPYGRIIVYTDSADDEILEIFEGIISTIREEGRGATALP